MPQSRRGRHGTEGQPETEMLMPVTLTLTAGGAHPSRNFGTEQYQPMSRASAPSSQ